jgi:hypothetical protein
MSLITVLVIMYAYTFLVSFLLIRLVAWSYKLKEKNTLIQMAFKIFWGLYVPFSSVVILFIGKKAESQDDGALHAVICLIIYMFAFVYALAILGHMKKFLSGLRKSLKKTKTKTEY